MQLRSGCKLNRNEDVVGTAGPSAPRPAAAEIAGPSAPRPAAAEIAGPSAPRPAAAEIAGPSAPRPAAAGIAGPSAPRPAAAGIAEMELSRLRSDRSLPRAMRRMNSLSREHLRLESSYIWNPFTGRSNGILLAGMPIADKLPPYIPGRSSVEVRRARLRLAGEAAGIPSYIYEEFPDFDFTRYTTFNVHETMDQARSRRQLRDILALATDVHPYQPTVESNKCAICCSELKAEETVRTLPCMHSFHRECVDPWFHTTNTCPYCRSEVFNPIQFVRT